MGIGKRAMVTPCNAGAKISFVIMMVEEVGEGRYQAGECHFTGV